MRARVIDISTKLALCEKKYLALHGRGVLDLARWILHLQETGGETRTDYVRRPAAGIYRRFSKDSLSSKGLSKIAKNSPKKLFRSGFLKFIINLCYKYDF